MYPKVVFHIFRRSYSWHRGAFLRPRSVATSGIYWSRAGVTMPASKRWLLFLPHLLTTAELCHWHFPAERLVASCDGARIVQVYTTTGACSSCTPMRTPRHCPCGGRLIEGVAPEGERCYGLVIPKYFKGTSLHRQLKGLVANEAGIEAVLGDQKYRYINRLGGAGCLALVEL